MSKIDRSEKKIYMNRLSFLDDLFKTPVRYILHKLGEKHIKNHAKLVVFSFDHIGHTINIDGLYEKDYLEFLLNGLAQISIIF